MKKRLLQRTRDGIANTYKLYSIYWNIDLRKYIFNKPLTNLKKMGLYHACTALITSMPIYFRPVDFTTHILGSKSVIVMKWCELTLSVRSITKIDQICTYLLYISHIYNIIIIYMYIYMSLIFLISLDYFQAL